MYVRPRLEPPHVVLREYFCPQCAGVLGVDVAHDELDPLPAPELAADTLAEVAPPG